jgi:hypothetical protein
MPLCKQAPQKRWRERQGATLTRSKHFRQADSVKLSAFIVCGLTVLGLALIFGFTEPPLVMPVATSVESD